MSEQPPLPAKPMPPETVTPESAPPDTLEEARVQKAREDLAKNYRDQFAASSARTGTTLLSWAAALIILLVNPVAPLIYKTNELRRLSSRIVEGHRELTKDAEAKGPRSGARDTSIKRESYVVKMNEAAFAADFRRLEKIKTPLGDLELPVAFIPPLYSMLLAGFVVYLLHRRLVLNAMALEVVHLHVEALRRPAAEIHGFGAWAPFWLAPLPRIVAETESSTKLLQAEETRLDFLGWRRSLRRKTFWFTLMMCAVAMIWIRVILLARQIDLMQHGRPFVLFRWETHSLLLLAVTIVCLFYVRPVAIWGAFPERLIVESRTRRAFLSIAFAAMTVFVAVAILPRRYWRYVPLLRSPRFRRRKRQQAPLKPPMVGQFVASKNSRVVRYADTAGWLIHRPSIAPAALELVSKNGFAQAFDIKNIKDVLERKWAKALERQRIRNQISAAAKDEYGTPAVVMPEGDQIASRLPIALATHTPFLPEPMQPTVVQPLPVGLSHATEPHLAKVVPSKEIITKRAQSGSTDTAGNVLAVPSAIAPQQQEKRFRLDRPTSGVMSERLALQYARQNRLLEAVRVAWVGVLLDTFKSLSGWSPNYRLYDLLSGLAHRGDIDLEKAGFNLAQHVATYWPRDYRLQGVIDRLKNRPARWSQRWKAPNLAWPKEPGPTRKRGKRHRERSLPRRHRRHYNASGGSVF